MSSVPPGVEALWRADNVELTTVGIDIGSSTSHLMFSRVHLQRLGRYLSSRFVVVRRQVLWRSPILLTPYLSDRRIDAERLGAFIAEAYEQAGLRPADVDSGAVILTGEALKRANARAIDELFAEQAGKFVCATAGHNLEALLAARGSGAVALSAQRGQRLLHVDVGGGTSKLALVQGGQVHQTAAIEVGGRLVAFDERGRLVRLEAAARRAAEAAGICLELGQPLGQAERQALASVLVRALVEALHGPPESALARDLMLTPPLQPQVDVDAVTCSGGVAEYLYGYEARDFGDLAPLLAAELRAASERGELPGPLEEGAERIRATAVGASQFSVQLSGSTISISDESILPIHNLQVLFPHVDLALDPCSDEIASAIRDAYARFDLEEGGGPIALAFRWRGSPSYRRFYTLAAGIAAGLASTLERRHAVALVFDRDVGKLIGDILHLELGVSSDLISIDGMELSEFDYVDIGRLLRPANAVPVVIKSLIFPEPSAVSGQDRAGY